MNNHIKAQILLLCFCQLIIIAAMEMSNPFLPIYLQSLGDFDLLPVNAWNVLAYAMPLISAMLFSPFWGKYADRFGYKTMILRAALALAIIQLLIYLTNSALLFVILRFIQGAIAGFLLAAQSYAVVIVSKEFRSRILAWLQSATAIGIAIGPLVGGILATLLSYNQIFLICAVIACCIFIILLIKLESISNPSLLSKQDNNKNCYHKNTSNNYLIYVYFSVIFLAILLSQTAKFLPQSFFAIYAKEFFSSDPIIIAAIYAAPAFSLLLFSAPIGYLFDKLLNKQVNNQYFFASSYFIILFAISTVAIYVHGFTHNIYLILAARFILGVTFAGTLPCLFSLACRTKDNNFGFLIGYCNTFSKFGNLCGIFLGGFIFQISSMQTVFYVTAIIYMFLVIIYICLLYLFDLKSSNFKNKELINV
ncbi:rhizoferrin export MFS transporter FslB [Francisella tularensis]|uniref:rhizoferrin export MFS transporter FslB n=1 Tax=Francisella tularensis TaxID=263 RepID=UPI000158B099|nr:rhizoferrin export MFS transporter FslB [Francisella tularensis]AJI45376.1 reduced folate carrier family protein [Francisella tularensis subsp. novicida F6168]APC99090.1 reduced folate carrier family protein [Francisella tularensis subsp. novicida]EDN36963.1 hypothetical protein FTCG_01682 [Francisella tularensis subsp. novicida GA99-3549]